MTVVLDIEDSFVNILKVSKIAQKLLLEKIITSQDNDIIVITNNKGKIVDIKI